jgi:hypothetical protein
MGIQWSLDFGWWLSARPQRWLIRAYRSMPWSEQLQLATKDQPEYVDACLESATKHQMVGQPLLMGRYFLPEEGVAGRDHVVILTYKLWRSWERIPTSSEPPCPRSRFFVQVPNANQCELLDECIALLAAIESDQSPIGYREVDRAPPVRKRWLSI